MAQTKAQLIDGKGDAVINNKLLVGTSTARGTVFTSNSPQLQVEGTSAQTSMASIIANSNDTGQAYFVLGKTRGTSGGSNTVVQSGDYCGTVSFQGVDGSKFVECARIDGVVDGTPGANDMPGRLSFSTTADGASSPTERMRIANDGSFSSVIPGGSTLYPQFACRAWVNFNGTGTVAIRASGNVSSITDNGTGDYTVNFTTAMVDANYAMVAMCEPSDVPGVGATFYTVVGGASSTAFTRTTSSAQIKTAYITSLSGASTSWDSQGTHVAIFR